MLCPLEVALLGGMALLELVYHCGGGLEVSYAQATLSVVHSLLLQPEDQDVELPATFPATCLPACHDDNELNL